MPAQPTVDAPYRWTARFHEPLVAAAQLLPPTTMTAAEQMFFLGAPLAHVVAYERLLKTARLLRPQCGAARLSRLTLRRAELA